MTREEVVAEAVMVGLDVSAFDIITLKQFREILKRHNKKVKVDKSLESYAMFVAIGNAFRKDGEPYRDLWDESNGREQLSQEELEQHKAEREALFSE